jgi:PAS domain S-box-containing protein
MTDAAAAADDWRRLMYDETTAALLVLDCDGVIRSANAQMGRVFGYAPGELIGRPLARLFSEALPQPDRWCGVNGLRRDGAHVPLAIRLVPLEGGEGAMLATIFERAEEEDAEALSARAEELERANERLARFAFVASQDLQEPLRKIAAFGDLMEEAILRGDHADIVHANEVMRRAAMHARALVEDLLSFSRIVNDTLELAVVDLRGSIELSLAALAQAIAETNARVEVDVPAIPIEADPTQLQRLLQNIVANAIKYRKPGRPATIEVSAFCDETSLCLAIADDGIGFEAQYAQKVFEPLRRLHSTVDYPGSGVGLAMCKAIADRHGWRISVEAKPGVGATFFIVLPIRQGVARDSEAADQLR